VDPAATQTGSTGGSSGTGGSSAGTDSGTDGAMGRWCIIVISGEGPTNLVSRRARCGRAAAPHGPAAGAHPPSELRHRNAAALHGLAELFGEDPLAGALVHFWKQTHLLEKRVERRSHSLLVHIVTDASGLIASTALVARVIRVRHQSRSRCASETSCCEAEINVAGARICGELAMAAFAGRRVSRRQRSRLKGRNHSGDLGIDRFLQCLG
jgi:hypothetical protein